jgi:hypothetical protein
MKEMKDWYMVFVLIAVLVTPLLPQLLKKKCPKCTKRALSSLEANPDETAPSNPYLSFYACQACGSRFKQVKSEPLVLLDEELKEPAQASASAL